MDGDNNVVDIRKYFIVSLISSYYKKPIEEAGELYDNEELTSFLDDPSATLLTARLTPQTFKIVLDNKANLEEDDESVVIFYKRSNETITPENIHKIVGTVTMFDSPTSTLYQILNKAFIPGIFTKNSKVNKNAEHAKLQEPMAKLEQALNNEIQSHQTNQNGRPRGITSISDEKGVWSTASNYAKNTNEKEIAAWIFNLVDTIDKELNTVTDWSSGTQIFGTILNSLDDIWKMGEKYYPESRMIHFLDIVGHEITLTVQSALKAVNLWDTPFNDLEKHLLWGMTMCEKYIDTCHNLTGMLWPNDASRQFHRGEYTPPIVANYSERLKEIIRIRSVHKQLVSLVSLADADILHPKKCFVPFAGINPIFYNVYTEPVWKHAVDKFEKLIMPAESSISNRLLGKLNVEANAFQLLAEYKRYKELIMRPKVAQAIQPHREQFLLKLIGVSNKIKTEFMEKKSTDIPASKHVSPTIASIYYARKSLYRMKDIESIAGSVLKDLNGYEQLASQIVPIKVEIETFENQVFNTWLNQLTESINNKELTLNKNDAVIEFSDGRLMEVTYNPKLVNVIDEAQQLATMGFRIPREVQDAVVEAKKFLKQAKELDQIANFHNTIGDRMIPSQRPMMLEAAVALSKLVQAQNGITWDEGDEVEKYITSLKNLVNILARQNNILSQYHIQVKNKVKGLFEVDLVRQQPKWKNVMQEIRQIFTEVQDQSFKNMRSWESHWDRQLYKVLEVKYLQGMVKVHEALPEIHIELVYRQQKLQFKPPLEEARMKYYTNLKRFLLIPKQFRGVTDENPDDLIFGVIVNRNCHRFEKLYRDAELCMSKVAATKNRFEDWVSLGSADIDALSKECLVSWEDWDRNFKTSKAKGQEISRLPTADEKIGCFVISFAVLRFEIELLNRKYWEVLVTLLQNSIIQEMATAETFLNDAVEKLRLQPTTVEEIAVANALEEQLQAQVPEHKLLLESIDKKNKTLALWTKDRTDLSRIKGLWENFLSLFENHQFLIGRQVETIKGSLEQQVKSLNDEAEIFKIRWDELKPKEGEIDNGTVKLDDIISFIHEKRQEWDILVQRREKIMQSCINIGIDQQIESSIVGEIEDDLKKVESTWLQLEEYKEGLKEYEEEDWIVFRNLKGPQRLEEFLIRWEGLFKNEAKSDVIIRILKDVESYKTFLPNLKYIRGDSFTEKHWFELFNILKIPSKQLGQLKVGDFLKSRNVLEEHLKEIQELNLRAAGEITVRQALNELDAWEIEAKFDLAEHQDAQKKTVYVIQDFKSLLNKVGDNQSLLQSIRTSPFYSHFADRISVWETRLGDLDEYIQNLNKVQRRWIYLEPIFSQGVLETEQQRFKRINEEYRGIMDSIGIDNRVVGLCKIQGIRNRLNMLVDQLSRCQNSLNEFLEKKRSGFPRFYFLGDDDLLEILGQSTKPNVIQAHLKKLFAGIFNVDFDDGHQHITAMKSVEEEVVPLKSHVKISSNVEEWLSELANEMKYTLKSSLLDCIAESKKNSRDPEKYPAQILTLCNAIQFNERCEEGIRSGKLQELLQELKSELETFTNIKIPENPHNPKLPKVMELKFKDLILDTIHEMDVVEFLIREGVKNVNEWCWQKQLRFYLRDDGSATVKMADAEFTYSYEYQGNAPRLVHTPLTDKCYLTLTQGMRMGLGGNPYGPAGTGKTESVKALGGLLGRQVLVFNCDEGIDVKSMGRIFVGLVKCGAWGCFDEVNRLEGATLSAVSMQIQPIQLALKTGAKTLKLMDEVVTIDSNAGIFVTLNPAGKGYGGRNKLPDNLKQLFRPVVMSQPDNELIAEVILYMEGFKNAKKIGRKLVEIFKLSSRLLTQQQHYDWGLRALKTVLNACGSALKDYKSDKNVQITEEDESDIVVATLRLNTLPKLTYSDCFRFDSLIKDVFPSVTFKELGHQDLAQSVRDVCDELKLTVNENQVKKCLELYEQLQQRMGVVIVGPSCCGKTTVVSLLKNALLRMGQKIKTHFINPKAILRTQLLGQINLDTRQWTDGVLTLKAQQVYAEPPDITSWIICDGDVDPEWVESLNSVLDDNRLLTLPSGWRIKFGSNVNFIFETHDLSYASPATISRMGMIFMSEEDADMKGIIATWLAEEPPESKDNISQLINDHFFKAINWILPQYDVIVQLPLVSIVKNALSQMRKVQNVSQMAVAMIRGFGGHLSRAANAEFAQQVLSWTGLSAPREWNLLNLYYNENTMALEVFQDEELEYSENCSTESPPLVQTTDVKQILDLIKPWLENRESFLLVGPEGTGKSMILEHAFSHLRSTEVATIHCSGLVSPQHVLQKLTQYCITVSTNSGRVYKSKDGERLILYFKDLNLVKPDKWGTCQLVEFLQQVINYKGFYDSNLEWVGIEGIQIVASINPGVSSARHALSPRFTSIIRVGSMGDLQRTQLETICRSYMKVFFKYRYANHKILSNPEKIEKLSKSTIQFYESMKTMFKASNQNHYQFTPRDLTKWILGLMRYDFDDAEENIEEIIMAWTYETCRNYKDKLVSLKEKDNFDKALTVLVSDDWGVVDIIEKVEGYFYVSDMTRQGGTVTTTTATTNSEESKKRTGNHSNLGQVDKENLAAIVDKGVNIFAREYRNLSLVTFPEVLQNVANIDRALSARHGCMVLAGRSGVGRRTAVSIVSALHGAIPFTLKVGRNYTIKNFKLDLKSAIQMSAVEGNKLYFIIEDFQLIDVIFLDMLNSLLSSGEVPGLYTPEELDGIIAPLREAASLEGHTSSLYSYFAGRVQQLLRIILIMDFTNENFLRNCESNPAIYKQCFFLWMDVWSTSSLSLIPSLIIEKYYKIKEEIEAMGLKEAKKATNEVFMKGFQRIYDSLEPGMSSPRRFIALIHNYATLFNQRTKHISLHMSRLAAGVSKLAEAKEIVERLKVDAAEQEVVLAKKQAEANKALELITETMRNANTQRSEVQNLREQTAKENETLEQKKKSIDAELADIEPEVKKAQASVGSIKNEAISEIRSLRAPPEVIRDILEAVIRLMGIMDMSWNSMKLFLSQRGVKDEIRNFDARKISRKDRDAVEKLLQDKPDSFTEAAAKRASAAAAPLAAWVMANVKYSRALEKIEPLERQQSQLQQSLTAAEDQLGQLSSELLDVDKRVTHLKANLNKFTKEAAETEIRLTKAKDTLVAAEGLVGKLEDEFTRWSSRLSEYGEELKRLPTKTLMAAAFITYLSEASEDIRERYTQLWTKALKAGDFNLLDFLSTEQELRNWQASGLPSDRLSLENGLIINQTTLRPYLIDPTSRAGDWLKTTMEKSHQVVIISLQDQKFPHELELAVRFGKVLVVSEADSIEPILVPILRGDITCQGTREMVQIGDKFVDMNPNFRVFMITRNPQPKIPPDAASVITTVNFTTTRAGLTSQLMTNILEIEKPELREKNIQLLKNVEEMKQKLSDMGDQLLLELANAQGNILENQELLNSLNKTKENSTEIENSLTQQSVLEASLKQEINVYLPLAEFGSLIYFSLLDLAKLNATYQFSLSSFINLFVKTLKAPNKNTTTDARISALKQDLENAVFDHVCRSLFKEDRLAFAMSLAHAMHSKLFHENEWEAFTGQLVTDMNAESLSGFKKMMPSWINEDRVVAVLVLKTAFPHLYEKLNFADENTWNEFYSSNECEDHLPEGVKESCSAFQILMIIQTLRPDRLHTAMTTFSRLALGRRFLFPPPMNLSQVFGDTIAEEPILLLIQSGADPSQELRELAHTTVGNDKFIEISMGQGEADMIIDQLNEAADKGYWICLKNLHLVTHWLDSLEKHIQKLRPNLQFRLWLTSEPHQEFPTVLAQTCLKIAYEAPQGLKKNLQQTYSNWSEEYVSGDRNILRIQSLLVLGIFHAVVQERRTFIPQGWSKFYEFNESDIRAGADVLDQMFKGPRSKDIQWQYVRGLFENAIYGGRVDNVYDVRVLVSYLDEYFNDLVLTGSAASRKSLCNGLKIPSTTKAQDYLDVINSMPEFDKPASFGLPGNIERSWQRVVSSQVIGQLKTLSRIFTDSTRYDRNIWYREISPILNLWKKLVQGSSVATILQVKTATNSPQLDPANNADPIEAFVRLENFMSMKLLKFVHAHLGAISKTVRGSATPSSLVFDIGDSLLKRQTPAEWLKKWEGPEDPTVYLQGLVRRALSIMEWETKTNNKQLLDSPLDLSDLLNPDTFLSAFKQQCARKLGVSMDELRFKCSWERSQTNSAKNVSCKLTGLLLEGCSFDGLKLMENNSDSQPIVRVPDCTISWVSQADISKKQTGTLEIPLYYNETRTRVIGSLDLPSSGDHSKWIQAGVAVFLKT